LKYLYHITQVPAKLRIGNKARGLKKLLKQHFLVPETWVIPAEVQEIFVADPPATRNALFEALSLMTVKGKSYAVRSSGELEDRTKYSFAGQFATFLNRKDNKEILEAAVKVWDSANKVSEGDYYKILDVPEQLHGMGVIVQEMIDSEWSGVAFSIHPVTGRNETVIEGVRGSGEQLVQDGLTPERWIFHQGSWEQYSPSSAPPAAVLKEIVDGICQLRKNFGSEVDVEWSWDGSRLYYLQCRSVTTSKFPTIYSNHISREMLPGMIKPLVWSINIPVVNSAWLRLLGEMLGKLDIMPEQLSRAFYYRAYFNMGTLGALFNRMGMPRDSLESLMGRKDSSGKSSFKPSLRTMQYLPGILWFLLSNLTLGRKFERKIRELNQESAVLEQELENFSPKAYRELFEKLHALSREMAYWNILIPLTMQITSRMLQRKIEKRGADFSQIDFTQDFPELLNHDPHIHLRKLYDKWISFPDEIRQGISSYQDLVGLDQSHPLNEVREELQQIIARFGHFSESGNDFSYTPWREDPGFVFDLMKEQRGHGQIEAGITKEAQNEGADKAGKNANKKIVKNTAYKRAGRYRLYREMISSSYTRTYGLFRKLFLHTGQLLTAKHLLSEPGQVFYLSLEEHNKLLAAIYKLPNGNLPAGVSELSKKADQVKREMESYVDLSLPAVIYGETPPPIAAPNETLMKGIPTSPGVFEGEIVVVKGYKDFKKEVAGKILVIPFSDVGWTPLLSRAGAIVAESGGVLSHASIIARELSLPAISSVDHACTIPEGTRARVDGYNGIVILDR